MVALSGVDTNKCDQIIQYKHSVRTQRKHTTKAQELQANDKEICGNRVYPQYDDQSNIVGKRRREQKWLTPEEVEQIVIAYQNGANIYELGDQYNCDRQTISRNLKKQGVNVTTEKLTSETDIQNLIKLYTDGLNTLQLAKHFSVSVTTIIKHLHLNNVKMRTRWDYYTPISQAG